MDGINWSSIGAQIAAIGLPALGTVVGSAVLGPVGGGAGAALGKGAAMMVAQALGVDATPEAVSSAIAADPDGSRIRLAMIDAEVKERAAELADVANARAMGVALADKGWMGKTPAVLSYLLLFILAAMIAALFFVSVEIPERLFQLLSTVFGAVTLAVGQMFQYWFGSSRGSEAKNAQIADLSRAAAGGGGFLAQISATSAGRRG